MIAHRFKNLQWFPISFRIKLKILLPYKGVSGSWWKTRHTHFEEFGENLLKEHFTKMWVGFREATGHSVYDSLKLETLGRHWAFSPLAWRVQGNSELGRVTWRKLWSSVRTPAFWCIAGASHWPNLRKPEVKGACWCGPWTSGSRAAEKGGEWVWRDKRKVSSTKGPCVLASSSHLCSSNTLSSPGGLIS